MRKINVNQITEIIADIENELSRMNQLEKDIKETYEKNTPISRINYYAI
ncbi:hypothetical protein [Cyanobacterium aponinum]|nr:hypothetical protein [Cyanobacterium aponinum]